MLELLPKHKHLWLLVIAPPLVAAVGWLLSLQLRVFDKDVLERLLTAFGSNQVQIDQAVAYGSHPYAWPGIEAVIQLGLSFASAFVGYRLPLPARLIVLVQLFALSQLALWGLWRWCHIIGHPLASFTSVFVGCATGWGIRMIYLQRRKSESQYYELLLRNRELQETKLQIVKQDEVERRMLAADLHDQVLNDLKQVVHRFDNYTQSPNADNAANIKALLQQTMGEIREVMDSLCPSALEHLGLTAAIEDCLRRGSERGGFKGRFRTKLKGDELTVLSMVEQSLVYRLVQESITNICKHASASTVRASVELENDHLVIKINDDGRGIDPANMRADSRGLRYMRQRADLIGATITWHKGDNNRGTVVEIRMDLSGRQNDKGAGS